MCETKNNLVVVVVPAYKHCRHFLKLWKISLKISSLKKDDIVDGTRPDTRLPKSRAGGQGPSL